MADQKDKDPSANDQTDGRIRISEEALARGFDEWQQRFKAAPEQFTAEPTAEACAAYLLSLIEDRAATLDGDGDEGGPFPPPPGQTSGPG